MKNFAVEYQKLTWNKGASRKLKCPKSVVKIVLRKGAKKYSVTVKKSRQETDTTPTPKQISTKPPQTVTEKSKVVEGPLKILPKIAPVRQNKSTLRLQKKPEGRQVRKKMEKKSHKTIRNSNMIVSSGVRVSAITGSAVTSAVTLTTPTLTAGQKHHTTGGNVVATTIATTSGLSSSSKHRSSNSSHHYHAHHGHNTSHHHPHPHSQKQQTQVHHAPSPALMLAVGKTANESSKSKKITSTQITNAAEHAAAMVTTVSPKLTTTTAMRNKNEGEWT